MDCITQLTCNLLAFVTLPNDAFGEAQETRIRYLSKAERGGEGSHKHIMSNPTTPTNQHHVGAGSSRESNYSRQSATASVKQRPSKQQPSTSSFALSPRDYFSRRSSSQIRTYDVSFKYMMMMMMFRMNQDIGFLSMMLVHCRWSSARSHPCLFAFL